MPVNHASSLSAVVRKTARAAVNMAANRVSTNLSSVLSVCHLVFTILALAILSYKVYYLEKEMSFIRKEISSVPPRDDPSTMQATPLSTAPNSEQHIIERNRRSQKKSEASSEDKLREKCLQTLFSNIQVCLYFLWLIEGSTYPYSRRISCAETSGLRARIWSSVASGGRQRAGRTFPIFLVLLSVRVRFLLFDIVQTR